MEGRKNGVMKKKCPLCFGGGQIESNEDEGWKAFVKHSTEYMTGFRNGYDKCTTDDRMCILRDAFETAKPYLEQLTTLFLKFGGDTEGAKTMAHLVCTELGLNKNLVMK